MCWVNFDAKFNLNSTLNHNDSSRTEVVAKIY